MRCSPIGLYYQDFNIAKVISSLSIKETHDSQESLRGVQSIVSAIHMALHGSTKLQIKAYVEENFGHMMDMNVEQLRELPKTTIRCNVTSTPSIDLACMESDSYESAIRNAVYTKGDTDTISPSQVPLPEAFYGVKSIPQEMIDGMKERITRDD